VEGEAGALPVPDSAVPSAARPSGTEAEWDSPLGWVRPCCEGEAGAEPVLGSAVATSKSACYRESKEVRMYRTETRSQVLGPAEEAPFLVSGFFFGFGRFFFDLQNLPMAYVNLPTDRARAPFSNCEYFVNNSNVQNERNKKKEGNLGRKLANFFVFRNSRCKRSNTSPNGSHTQPFLG